MYARAAACAAVFTLALGATQVAAHGNVTPQAVDVSSLKPIGDEWLASNPYRGNKEAIRIGASAFNQNCARCHGLEAISGGIAPDLRYLPPGDEGDEIFLNRIRHGSVRGGRVYMPPFEGILQQEAMWSIRSWLETVHVED
ncbi:cytochrome c-550 PedF [Nitrogeniibacter mangrovi]|uniref:Cytochrome c-550 PedF n=1 Tax=Nitrogeniibacter mangrovi TaxID=2016596 RepID=A0A6C1B9S2_9RHOO|nr:cytochrome c-550 PedF [Nitrogeniibacter mangrovi]QID19759.1 cytochrome c-550 PedF [Nitrogeniibacter mangrovi]